MFERGKTYCELCLDELDPIQDTCQGYTACCNERAVGFLEAQQIYSRDMTEVDEDDYTDSAIPPSPPAMPW